MYDYPEFPSIERFDNVYCIITEKIDGTNGLIEIGTNGITEEGIVMFGSRKKYLYPGKDNYGFLAFFSPYVSELLKICKEIKEENTDFDFINNPPIRIYGEWFGKGINRGYNLSDRQFMPFNSYYADKLRNIPNITQPEPLHQGKFSREILNDCMNFLREEGSQVVPGYKNPEGVVAYFPKYKFSLKETFDGPKWKETYKVDRSRFRDIPKACDSCGRGMFIDRDEKDHNPEFSEDYHRKNGYHAICLKNKECPAHGKYV